MSNTAARVFAVPELLEAILLQLPPRDLLLAQRADKTFRDSINTSVHIQQKLFFKSNSKMAKNGSSDLNPFFGRIITLAGREWSPYRVRPTNTYRRMVNRTPQMVLNGRKDISYYVDKFVTLPYTIKQGDHVLVRRLSRNLTVVDKFQESEHSWQKMLIADPPCFVMMSDDVLWCSYRSERVTAESMGDLMEVLDRDLIKLDSDSDEAGDDGEGGGSDGDTEKYGESAPA